MNTLDNRKSNLRVVTKRSNTVNRKGANKNNQSGERNVSLIKGWYYVQFQIEGKNTCVAKFRFFDDAKGYANTYRNKIYTVDEM
ncbi:hypothetical protein [Paenibacillus radicibacter]|uniref:hypothetical protein n=1 Tax=Paenibacillus radicibacter TaxID=2972488 RepID=UPI002158EC50|nr:hypothetical protein [Paenibacillus radicibacter]